MPLFPSLHMVCLVVVTVLHIPIEAGKQKETESENERESDDIEQHFPVVL